MQHTRPGGECQREVRGSSHPGARGVLPGRGQRVIREDAERLNGAVQLLIGIDARTGPADSNAPAGIDGLRDAIRRLSDRA
jgi:hypothetical protein